MAEYPPCPECSGASRILGETSAGNVRLKCKECGKSWTLPDSAGMERARHQSDPLLKLMRLALKAAEDGEEEAVGDFRSMRKHNPMGFMKFYRDLEREDAEARKAQAGEPAGGAEEPLEDETTESLLKLIGELLDEYHARKSTTGAQP